MQYHKFPAIPTELKLEIIRKCYPIPYIRLRRSCRPIDELCEENRRSLGIYCYRKNPTLDLRCGPVKRKDADGYVRSCYLLANYGRDAGGSRLFVPMIRESFSRMRRSLSGFAFTYFRVIDYAGGQMGSSTFQQGFDLFLEIADEFRVKELELWNVTVDQTKRLLEQWRIKHLALFADPEQIEQVMGCNHAKMVASVYCTYGSGYEKSVRDIVEMAKNRKCARINSRKLTCSIAWGAMECIFKGWKKVTELETLELQFLIKNDPWTMAIHKQGRLHLPEHSVYFGQFPASCAGECNIWLIKAGNQDHWRLLTISKNVQWTESFFVQTARSKEELTLVLIDFISDHRFWYRIEAPVDFSPFYIRLVEAATLDDVRCQYLSLLLHINHYPRK